MISVYNNEECLKCKVVNKEMRGVGCLVFCEKCCAIEFHSINPMKDERPKYLKWVEKRKKQWDKE